MNDPVFFLEVPYGATEIGDFILLRCSAEYTIIFIWELRIEDFGCI
jgi:hypothetical protein